MDMGSVLRRNSLVEVEMAVPWYELPIYIGCDKPYVRNSVGGTMSSKEDLADLAKRAISA